PPRSPTSAPRCSSSSSEAGRPRPRSSSCNARASRPTNLPPPNHCSPGSRASSPCWKVGPTPASSGASSAKRCCSRRSPTSGRGLSDLGPEVTRLVIVPDGPLHRLPWDALRLADGRHVVERYAVSLAPSAAVVAALWRRARERGPATDTPVRLLAFGDPAFARPDAARDDVSTGSEAAEIMRSAFDASGGAPARGGPGRRAPPGRPDAP